MIRYILGAFLLALPPSVFAAEVLKVKGKGVLVDLRGDPAVSGDRFYLISPEGKRRGLMVISKVKGDKAIGKITKGQAAPGYTLEFKTTPSSSSASKPSSRKSHSSSAEVEQSSNGTRGYWGGIFGFSRDSMSVHVTGQPPVNADLGTVAMSGYGFSAKGLFDYELFPQIWFRGSAGIETFNAEAAAPAAGKGCGPSNNDACTAKLMYLTFDFVGRYVFSTGNLRPWLGGGIGLLFPASKDATALDTASITTTTVVILAGGLDYFVSPSLYIPVSVEYGILPKSDEVEATWIGMRAGFAVPF